MSLTSQVNRSRRQFVMLPVWGKVKSRLSGRKQQVCLPICLREVASGVGGGQQTLCNKKSHKEAKCPGETRTIHVSRQRNVDIFFVEQSFSALVTQRFCWQTLPRPGSWAMMGSLTMTIRCVRVPLRGAAESAVPCTVGADLLEVAAFGLFRLLVLAPPYNHTQKCSPCR